ncbi:hypothetical protein [Pararhodobacter sp. CCB-MM2]|uniref:hypothetical protein n=1 Tax=Pararhodobacter sp. CCB-MM2 TaxID=1786003 RepID=UPI000837243C|nr:hypothetical protein [Pararhodobacter sp. CCB-MM2]
MTRFLTISMLCGAVALAACSPLQQCLVAADQDLRDVRRALDEHRGNLSRGYAIERIPGRELVPSVCPGENGQPVPCMRWDSTTEEIRHRINPEFERERIALLETQLARAEATSATARAQCQAAYPE